MSESRASFLDQIIQTKRQEVAERKVRVPIEGLKEKIQALGRPRNFFNAVTGRGKFRTNLIAEVKKASPSAGVIRADFDPVRIAEAYAEAGAAALSVLTDEPHFQGKLEYIQAVAECLETSQLIDLQILATEMNLTCLIEVHDMDNLMRVRDHVIGFPHRSYSLLGINNRDLRTFKTDLGTTLRMTELVEDRGVLVSESGIHTKQDVRKLADAGVRAVLIGESLMRSDDIGAKVKELFS
jgi:indole-3-glycerol phosphate synthase